MDIYRHRFNYFYKLYAFISARLCSIMVRIFNHSNNISEKRNVKFKTIKNYRAKKFYLRFYLVICVLLPLLDLVEDVVREVVPNLGVQVAPPVRLDEDALPGRLRGAVLRPLLDGVVPFLRPRLQRLGVVLLDVRPLVHEGHQLLAQLVAVLDALRGLLVVAGLPEGVARGYEHVVIAVVGHR